MPSPALPWGLQQDRPVPPPGCSSLAVTPNIPQRFQRAQKLLKQQLKVLRICIGSSVGKYKKKKICKSTDSVFRLAYIEQGGPMKSFDLFASITGKSSVIPISKMQQREVSGFYCSLSHI